MSGGERRLIARLAEQAVPHLPRGYSFVPGPEARAWLQMPGNNPGAATRGLVLAGEGRPDDGCVAVRFIPAGYVRDDDAKDWDADPLLRADTEAANAERRLMGARGIEVVGWIERPRCDVASHRLVRAAEARDNGFADDSPGVNYNTYALGRDGCVWLNLVTVVAAKKLGLVAVAAGLFLKFWNVLAVGAVVLAAPLAKRFRRGPPTMPVTMLISLAVYAQIFGWPNAAGFIAMSFVHELGHCVAAVAGGRRCRLHAESVQPAAGAAARWRADDQDPEPRGRHGASDRAPSRRSKRASSAVTRP